MEYASYLAGERWSDHPECTHPLLAGVARAVNDLTSDDGRPGLVTHIPSVVGLNGDNPGVDVGIAMRCAILALPIVASYRQRALAAGLYSARRVLDDLDSGALSPDDTMDLLEHARRALSTAPEAARWAEDFTAGTEITTKAFRRRSAPAMVRISIIGISEACIPDPDGMLHELLTTVIDDCTRWLDPPQVSPHPPEADRAARRLFAHR